jgi:hypothetical protein
MAIQRTSVSVPGFSEARIGTRRKRMIVASRGEDKDGKTQFGLTMPAPIAAFPFDNNTMEMIEKWQMFKKILVPTEPLDYTEATALEEWKPIWDRFEDMWADVVASKSIRSILLDTGSEAHELARLAYFGKLTEVMPTHYAKVNARFKRLIDMVYKTDKNILITHQLKDEYVKNNRTGERVLAGYAPVKYKVQINILHWRDLERRDAEKGTEGFGLTIINATQSPELAGTYLDEPDNTWTGLGKVIYQGTTDADWE